MASLVAVISGCSLVHRKILNLGKHLWLNGISYSQLMSVNVTCRQGREREMSGMIIEKAITGSERVRAISEPIKRSFFLTYLLLLLFVHVVGCRGG